MFRCSAPYVILLLLWLQILRCYAPWGGEQARAMAAKILLEGEETGYLDARFAGNNNRADCVLLCPCDSHSHPNLSDLTVILAPGIKKNKWRELCFRIAFPEC